ncbi:MAG TPA: hypothetical protein VJT73_11210 [Polyangiaceae bacterium]|nr:hypothetical protein [Polyangiaceae bacterium]
MGRQAVALGVFAIATARVAGAAPLPVDRAVVRFDAPETGGVARPRFVFERELAFESRLESLSDPDRGERGGLYLDRHVRAALERHIAEELLSHLAMDPDPTPAEIERRMVSARILLEHRVGGPGALADAAAEEGLGVDDVRAIVVREARASLYLDRMVAPMLEPSEAELREVHRSTNNPYRGQRFDDASPMLRKWYVGERLEAALGAFYQNARGRVHVVVLPL